jgi:hypothetical protein
MFISGLITAPVAAQGYSLSIAQQPSVILHNPDPGFEIEGWSITGNLTYRTNFIDPTLGPGQSELVFPATGTMPLLRVNWQSFVLRLGSGANSGTSTDSDWLFTTNPTNPVSVTQQPSSGTATVFTGDFLLGAPDSPARWFVGYASYGDNFTWTAPVILTACIPSPLIPTCPPLPFTEVSGTGTVLTYNATYTGPRVGFTGAWQASEKWQVSADFSYGLMSFSATDYHVLRNITFPQSGSGNAFIGQIAAGYSVTDTFSVRVGYSFATIHVSGTTMVCAPAFSSTCSAPFTLSKADLSESGVTLGAVWQF